MDPSVFDPEHRLRTLLGDSPKHPWGALIPQILLWSFRRFCIQKITVAEGKLMDSVWEDHLELVHMYTPRGLEAASMEWMTPENISHVSSPLEKYNRFFIDFIEAIDIIMSDDNIALQDKFSEFLDVKMGRVVSDWLSAMKEFIIFPMDATNDDEFTDDQFERLIENLVAFSKATRAVPEPVVIISEVPEAAEAPEVPKAPAQDPINELFRNHIQGAYDNASPTIWNYLAAPAMLSAVQPPQYVSEYVRSPAPPEPVVEPVAEPAPQTVAEAIKHRRMTLRRTGRRSVEPRVKTRRSHPAA